MKQKLINLRDFAWTYLLQNKSTKQTIIKNTFWLMGGEAISKLMIFFVTIWTARYLGVDGYGKFSFAFSFTALFSILIDFGFNTLTVREIAKDKLLAKIYIGNLLSIKILLSIISLFLTFIVIRLMGKPEDIQILVFLFMIYVIIQSFILFFQAISQAFEKMQYNFISRVT
ncbi:MAG: oligosaccharide flippase family protein, partial [Candidatus Levyibacteriota bacterium]